jgi:hypothetical protein
MRFVAISLAGLVMASSLFASLPSSSSYQLHNYGFGSGGTSNATSTNYGLNATTGETSNVESTSTNYKARSGNQNSQQAHVPDVPSLTNPASYYNKLKFIIAPGINPSDTLFSIAISSDNFATTQYIQSDNTDGPIKGIEDYQTYAAWGGASGQLVVGLSPSMTYKIKVNSFQGKFTETEYGPTASAATVAPSITFDIDVSAIDTETSPPYATSFGSLLPATVTNTPEKVWVDLDTNAESGAKVYISSLNGGLRSPAESFTLTSATADLAAVSTGYGAQGSTATQISGGPLSISAPYNVASQNVGILNATIREIFSTAAPVVAGRGSLQLKARAAAQTPAAADYQDTLTLTAAAAF